MTTMTAPLPDPAAPGTPPAGTPTPLCPCGQPADPDHISLAQFFPNLIPAPLCPDCIEEKSAADAERNAEEKRRQTLEDRRARIVATVPPEMRATTITHPTFNRQLWLRVCDWQPESGRWLGLVGGPGASKTRCLALLAIRLIQDGRHVAWTTACHLQGLVDALRIGHEVAKREAWAEIQRLKTRRILILDDIGKNTWNPSMERHLHEIVDHRKTHYLPILWTANTPLEQMIASGELTQERGGPLIGRFLEASRILSA